MRTGDMFTRDRTVGTNREIEHVAAETAKAFLAMAGAAQTEGRVVGLNRGFRSYPEQKQTRPIRNLRQLEQNSDQ